MVEEKTIENFKGAHGDNYEGFIEYWKAVELCDPLQLICICNDSRSKSIGDKVYYRCGIYAELAGTRVPLDVFGAWWDVLGAEMLTLSEIATLQADHAPEEDF